MVGFSSNGPGFHEFVGSSIFIDFIFGERFGR